MSEERTFLGRWKSGRVWKTPETAKSSRKAATTGVKGHSWAEKLAKRQKTQMEKALLEELKLARDERQQIAKGKRAARQKRKAENAAKMMNTHQVIVNSKKLKRMSKKQHAKLIKK